MDYNSSGSSKIAPIFNVTLYVLGIVMIFMAEHSSMNYVAPIVVGIIGMVRLIKSFLPEFIKTFKDKYLLEKRYALIYFSNLAYSIRRSVLLFSLIAGSVTGMVVIIATYYNSPREYITAIIGYIVIVVLLITSIVYKYCMEAQTRANLFYNLWKIGYTRS